MKFSDCLKSVFILVLSNSFIYAECYELNQTDCLYWAQYCEWNEETGQCQEIGGDSGGETGGETGGGNDAGPYQYATITESQGLRNGPDYRDGVLYYPIDGSLPYKSIVFTPGFGSSSFSMSSWAQFFASHGFIAMTIGPNDEMNDSHQQRGEGLLDAIESIKQENARNDSPLYGMIDENSFSVSGYSMGGGASHNAAMMDSSLDAVVSLNPTVLFEDCNYCPEENYDGVIYCICLVPELINHSIPSIIFAGEVEVDELPEYDGMLGQDIYINMSESTDKIMFEGAGSGHGFAAYPSGEVAYYALNWLKYNVLDDPIACDFLFEVPQSSSQYFTNIDCEESISGDINGDLIINIQDVILMINLVLDSTYDGLADINFDYMVDVLDVVLLVNLILN